MSDLPRDGAARLRELLADRAVGALSPAEQGEMEDLLAGLPGEDVSGELESVVAGLMLAHESENEPMPASMRARLEARGREMVGAAAGAKAGVAPGGDVGGATGDHERSRPLRMAADARTREDARSDARTMGLPVALPWLAAAAAILIAALAWIPGGRPVGPSAPTLAERREAVLARVDVVIAEFSPGEDELSAGVSGDVVWSGESQAGFVRLRGLAENDPRAMQYQLWVFDRDRDDVAVPAGVFDVAAARRDPSTGDVLVPLEPAVRIGAALAFAITAERPGGVVVTDRSRLIAMARVGSIGG
ncbi:MAG: anti-sigma factor [Phycisphaerales bacterium]